MFKSIVVLEKELAIKWENDEEGFVQLKTLRELCPCAWCSGEKDALGNVYKGKTSSLSAKSYMISSFEVVGLYGVRFFWKDGHSDGIYTIKKLKTLGSFE